MNTQSVNDIFQAPFLGTLNAVLVSNIPLILTIAGAMIGLGILVWYAFASVGESGTSTRLGQRWTAWDKMTYRPYKGYNRWRSKEWNLEHTANL